MITLPIAVRRLFRGFMRYKGPTRLACSMGMANVAAGAAAQLAGKSVYDRQVIFIGEAVAPLIATSRQNAISGVGVQAPFNVAFGPIRVSRNDEVWVSTSTGARVAYVISEVPPGA